MSKQAAARRDRGMIYHCDHVLTLIKGIMRTTILALILFTVSCVINPPPDENDKVFDKIDPTWTQEEVINKVKLALLQLSTQSQTLKSQYTNWETQLRSEISGSTDYGKLRQINFAQSVQGAETNLTSTFQRNSVSTVKWYAGYYIDVLIEAISVLIEDQKDTDLFKAQAEAFLIVHYINQREYYASDAEKASKMAELAEISSRVEQLGGQRIPLDSMYGAIVVSESQLRRFITRDCGEHREGFIQQFEDYAQFDAWTDDLTILGYSITNIPRAVLRKGAENGVQY